MAQCDYPLTRLPDGQYSLQGNQYTGDDGQPATVLDRVNNNKYFGLL